MRVLGLQRHFSGEGVMGARLCSGTMVVVKCAFMMYRSIVGGRYDVLFLHQESVRPPVWLPDGIISVWHLA
jgi:hypothetical protein